VIDQDGKNLGVLDRLVALNLAKENGLDLVLVSPNSNPGVAKIVSWAKFKYERNKKDKNLYNKKSGSKKEWWFKPTIGERDLVIKLEKVKKFLEQGGIAKLTVRMFQNKTGIRVTFEEIKNTMNNILNYCKDFSEQIGEVQQEGKNLTILIKSKKK